MKGFFRKKLPACLLALAMMASLIPAASAVSAGLTFDVDEDSSVWLDADDFWDLYDDLTGGDLEYVEFTGYDDFDDYGWFEADGYDYDDYVSGYELYDSDLDDARFYYDEDDTWYDYDFELDTLEFVTYDKIDDETLDFDVRLYGTKGTKYVTVRIEVYGSSSGSGDVKLTYKVEPNKEVTVDADDFYDLFDDEDGRYDELLYVEFTDYDDFDDYGCFYAEDYDYDEIELNEKDLGYGFFYYDDRDMSDRSDEYDLDTLTFAADRNADDDTLAFDFTMRGVDGDKVYGTLYIEIGKGITFRPKNDWFELTMRFRMQNLLALSFDDDFTLTKTEARVKRLRLRFDGYIYSPKLVYSVQLGFTSYDTEPLPGGDMNIVRDAIVYYVPNATWNIGFGQTKIKANRARINSSSALQFVDRSIVNSEFNLDRDFGFFGEYNMRHGEGFNLSAKGSVTLGEGRNWGSSPTGGLAYTGRLELYPLGRFKSKGDVIEGNYEFEERVKILLAGAYSYNHKASRLKGQRGAVMPGDATRNLGSYFVDFILEYRGFAFYTDFMGRSCSDPLFSPETGAFVYNGQGLNVQTSYLFNKKWEIALRNSTLFPDSEVQPLAGYRNWNQTTLGITRYIIGHSLKVQADMSYNTRSRSIDPDYNRWEIRFQLELGL